MNTRTLRGAGAALLLTVTLAACAENRSPDDDSGNGQEAPAAEGVTFAVGVDPAYSPIYLSDQNDLFGEADLDVAVEQYQEGAGGLDAVLSGQAQVTASTESSLLIRATRGDIKGLAVFSESPDFIKLVVREGIDDVADIARYGVVTGSVNEYATNKVLDTHGIERDAVEFVDASPAEMPALLQRGDVDGYIMWEPWPSRGVDNGGEVLLTSGDIGYVYNLVIAAGGDWYEANQDAATELVGAVATACAEITQDPALAATATETAIEIPADEAATLLEGVQCQVRDFTDDDLARYAEIAEFQADNDIVEAPADPTEVMIQGVA